MDALLTNTINQYITIFNGYLDQFLLWGKWLFYSLLTINVVWLALWYAFDRGSFTVTISDFIKRFFVIAFFYAIMINHGWLIELLQGAHEMGKTLTGIPLDPASIIANGIVIANKVLIPAQKASLMDGGLGMLIVFVTWLVTAFSFIGVALNLSLTLIVTTALISAATFFLGFIALDASSQIARRTLNAVLENCVRLLGIYLAVGVGARAVTAIAAAIRDKPSFDEYIWIMAACLLFWVVAKKLPEQLARLIKISLRENSSIATDVALQAGTVSRLPVAADGALGLAKIAGSSVQHVAEMYFEKQKNRNAK
jgi:P-type conjugative transfer protein TrbL